MNTSTEISVYDFLNYEIIGLLLLWLFCVLEFEDGLNTWIIAFVVILAYVVGFLFAKLVEYSVWIRNPKIILDQAKKTVYGKNSRDAQIDEYTRCYYKLAGKEEYKTIKILESQYAFVYNLWWVCILDVLIVALRPCVCTSSNELFFCIWYCFTVRIGLLFIVFLCLFLVGVVRSLMYSQLKFKLKQIIKSNVLSNLRCSKTLILLIYLFAIVIWLCALSNGRGLSARISLPIGGVLFLPYMAIRTQYKISLLVYEGAKHLNPKKRKYSEN